MSQIRDKIISAGVKNLKEFGYPSANDKNILIDYVYSKFFKKMLEENINCPQNKPGSGVDIELRKLFDEVSKVKLEEEAPAKPKKAKKVRKPRQKSRTAKKS